MLTEKTFKILGARLVKLRNLKTPQDVFAKCIGVTRQTISHYENSDRIPDAETLYKMCKELGCTADYLLGLDDAPAREVADICRTTPLTREAAECLITMKQHEAEDGMDVKALNLILTEYPALLAHLGMYLFGNIKGTENITVGNALVPIDYIRAGMLKVIEKDLQQCCSEIQQKQDTGKVKNHSNSKNRKLNR